LAGRFQGKAALVTGGSRGIGKATTTKLASEGARVCINYVGNKQAADELLSQLKGRGAEVIAVKADISNRSEVHTMVEEAKEKLGRIDILVNNAGILLRQDVFHLSEEELRRMFDVNVMGPVNCTSEVMQQMIDGGGGKIVFLASNAALGTSLIGTTPYALTKAAVITLTKRYALELGKYGINVNGVSPGFVETEMNTSRPEYKEVAERMIQRAELGRIGKPEDIANVVVFLCSEESSFMTGQILTVDGGRMDYLTRST
jgi:3-oxoacyl-[acyl-carrier protein] reductase